MHVAPASQFMHFPDRVAALRGQAVEVFMMAAASERTLATLPGGPSEEAGKMLSFRLTHTPCIVLSGRFTEGQKVVANHIGI